MASGDDFTDGTLMRVDGNGLSTYELSCVVNRLVISLNRENLLYFCFTLMFMGIGFLLLAGEIHGYPIDLSTNRLGAYGVATFIVGFLGFVYSGLVGD